jgi:prophage regulatory protein
MENIMKSELLPSVGFIRIRTVLQIIPVSRSAWYLGIQQGQYPKPIKLGPRSSAWRVQDIRALIDKFGDQQ